jgi:hypothetical protein
LVRVGVWLRAARWRCHHIYAARACIACDARHPHSRARNLLRACIRAAPKRPASRCTPGMIGDPGLVDFLLLGRTANGPRARPYTARGARTHDQEPRDQAWQRRSAVWLWSLAVCCAPVPTNPSARRLTSVAFWSPRTRALHRHRRRAGRITHRLAPPWLFSSSSPVSLRTQTSTGEGPGPGGEAKSYQGSLLSASSRA